MCRWGHNDIGRKSRLYLLVHITIGRKSHLYLYLLVHITIGRKSRLYLLVHNYVGRKSRLYLLVHNYIVPWCTKNKEVDKWTYGASIRFGGLDSSLWTRRWWDVRTRVCRCGHEDDTLCLCDTKKTKNNESGGLHTSVHYDSCTLSDLSLARASRCRGKDKETTWCPQPLIAQS